MPDELLVARDEGRVVFFCGAGVSRARAGLSDFLGLTKKVADKLAVATNSPTRKLIEAIERFPSIPELGSLVSADRVFGLIEREFLQRDIYAAIASCLRPQDAPDLAAHRTLLDLAKGPDGRTRLVTTNFDLLFEACDTTLNRSSPPRLPNPLRDDEFSGVVHLHGHVTDDYSTAAGDGLIISSAEFGRAYLSERWATDFIKSILERYIVVFVGYAADDPPMQYLLEALNRSAGSVSGVYAFQSGSVEDAEARWIQKGVKPIAYGGHPNHDGLWRTLEAWAVRARNPEDWYSHLIEQAQQGPEKLESYKRGQVAHIVSTTEGARRFANAVNPAPASWLCSFDPHVRFATPSRTGTMLERGPYFDPFEAYGLDSDPVPKKISPDDMYPKRETPSEVWDCFAPTRQDRQNLRDEHLAAFRGHYSRNIPRLSRRLDHLARWITKVAGQPAAVWWASRQNGLHPEVQEQIRYQLERSSDNFPPGVRQAWRYIFTSKQPVRDDEYGQWFEIAAAIKSDGWNGGIVRDTARVLRPYLTAQKALGASKAPDANTELPLSSLLYVDVKYPEFSENIPVPLEHLPAFMKELRRNLELGVALETEIGGYVLHSLDPIEDKPQDHPYGINKPIADFAKYFRQLAEGNPLAAKEEALAWGENRDDAFTLLRIWACGDERIESDASAGATFIGLDRNAFWASRFQRNLLLSMGRRWNALSLKVREPLEKKLLQGPTQWPDEALNEYKARRAHQVLSRIHWLASRGCKLIFDLAIETARLKVDAPDWKDSYASHAADSMASRSGWVQTDTESNALLEVPLSEVLVKAQALSGRRGEFFVEYDPYAGLAKTRPVRALAAIRNAPPEFNTLWAWQTYLNGQARKDDKPRLIGLIAGRIYKLSDVEFNTLIRPISDWLLRTSKVLLEGQRQAFESIWERLVASLSDSVRAGSFSTITESRQHDWATEALNSPAGYLAQALFNDLGPHTNSETRLPGEWRRRADQLLMLPGSSRKQALAIFCHNLTYLFHIDPIWTDAALVSTLSRSDAEDIDAFWTGFFWGARPPQQSLYLKMKQALLALAKNTTLAKRQYTENLAAILLIGWHRRSSNTNERVISNEEIRSVLLQADDEFRSRIVWQLDSWSQSNDGGLREDVLTLLGDVWPRQVAAKTAGASARLAELAFSREDDFPTYVDAVVPLVIPIDRDHITLPSLSRPTERSVIERFPEKTLQLLDAILPEDGRKWPYGIDDVLIRLGRVHDLGSDSRLIRLNRIWSAR